MSEPIHPTSKERTLLQLFVDMEEVSTYADPKKYWAAYAELARKARALLSGDSSAGETTVPLMMNDIPYHTIPQEIIDKVVEARRWFDEHNVKRWSVAGVGPLHVETSPGGWCEVCGGQNGEHKPGCVDGDWVL